MVSPHTGYGMKELKIRDTESGQRLDKFLRRYFPGAGSGFLYRMLRKKNIVLNGKKAEGKELLHAGDRIRVFFSDETFERFTMPPQVRTAEAQHKQQNKASADGKHPVQALAASAVVYENRDILVLSKPAGMLSQTDVTGVPSVNEHLLAYLRRKENWTAEQERLYRPGVLNRLDRNTSGLMLAAKNLHAAQVLSEAIRTRAVRKEYLALVRGKVKHAENADGWLVRKKGERQVQIVQEKTDGAAQISTNWKPLRFYPEKNGPGATLLLVELITGKTHQIRAHLSSAGHPLAGDMKYGDMVWNRYLFDSTGLSRQFLHAWRLTFPAEFTGLPKLSGKRFSAPLPAELEKVVQMLSNGDLEKGAEDRANKRADA